MSDIDKKHQNSNDLGKAPLIDHLIELRSRLIQSIIVFFIVFLISFYFSSDIHSFLVNPFFSIFAPLICSIHNNHLNNIGMYLTKKTKEDLFKKHGKDAKDTGSAEGQIALFTHRINHLTEHLKRNKKDYNTERALVKLVGKRRALLDYLTKKDILRYRAIVKELGLRK